MVEFYIDPEDVVSDFLRTELVDPKFRSEAHESNNFIATSGQTVFNLTPPSGSVSCITNLTMDSVDKTKWTDYFWDYQNSTVTFYDGLTEGQEVRVTFKYGTSNWIYSDRDDDKIKADSFPRISVFVISGGGNKIGNYQAAVHSTPVMQIDTWARNDQIVEIDSRKYSNNYLTRYLGNKVLNAFEDHEEDLFGIFFDYEILSVPKTAPYSDEFMSYHSVTEIMLHSTKLGRIVKEDNTVEKDTGGGGAPLL